MRTFIGCAAAVTLSLAACLTSRVAAAEQSKFASGRISYTMTGSAMKGTITTSWIEHGKRTRQETKGTVTTPQAPKGIQTSTWSITDGSFVYSGSSMMGNQVMKMPLPKGRGGVGSPGNPVFGSGAKGKKVGTGKVLGRDCEIRDVNGNKVWIWEGLPLKIAAQSPRGAMKMEATRIETDVKLSPDLFKVPAGAQVREMPFPGGAPGAGRAK